MSSLNREGWLTEVARRIESIFKDFSLAKYRVTCGWPCTHALGRRARRIGECHGVESSADGTHEIFISPTLVNPAEVSGTLVHELAHVAAGIEAAHGSRFVSVCRHVGLIKGRPTQVMPGPQLASWLGKITEQVGEYPHAKLEPKLKKVARSPGSAKLVCVECDLVAVIGRKWLSISGTPTCGCGGVMREETNADS